MTKGLEGRVSGVAEGIERIADEPFLCWQFMVRQDRGEKVVMVESGSGCCER